MASQTVDSISAIVAIRGVSRKWDPGSQAWVLQVVFRRRIEEKFSGLHPPKPNLAPLGPVQRSPANHSDRYATTFFSSSLDVRQFRFGSQCSLSSFIRQRLGSDQSQSFCTIKCRQKPPELILDVIVFLMFCEVVDSTQTEHEISAKTTC